MLLPIVVTAVFLSTTAIAQQPPVVAPKPSGHYLSKPSATDEEFSARFGRMPNASGDRSTIGANPNFEANMAAVVSQRRNYCYLHACQSLIGPPRQPLLTPRRLRPRTRLRRQPHLNRNPRLQQPRPDSSHLQSDTTLKRPKHRPSQKCLMRGVSTIRRTIRHGELR